MWCLRSLKRSAFGISLNWSAPSPSFSPASHTLSLSFLLFFSEIFQGYQTAHTHNWNQVSSVNIFSVGLTVCRLILLIIPETPSEGNVCLAQIAFVTLPFYLPPHGKIFVLFLRFLSLYVLATISSFLPVRRKNYKQQTDGWIIWLCRLCPARFEFFRVSEDGPSFHLCHFSYESQHAEGRPPVPVRTALSKWAQLHIWATCKSREEDWIVREDLIAFEIIDELVSIIFPLQIHYATNYFLFF